jgi:uncharacterized protein YpuA (DUF1002 family)
MSLNINGKEVGRKELVIVITCILLVVVVIVFTIGSYNNKQKYVNAAERQRVAAVELQEKETARLQAVAKAKRDADVTRLVSICIEAQERYAALTAKQQALETRPDCTVE